jgi:hypothetical protein
MLRKLLVALLCCDLSAMPALAGGLHGSFGPPTGKNQLGISPPFAFNNIYPFLNILKGPGEATTFATTPALASATWSGGVATFTTADNHSFYAGSAQSGWSVQIQNVSDFPGYNGNFSGATACTITGINTFTCPITSNPGGSSSSSGNAAFTLATSYPVNTPNSAYGQGNSINQYFDANGDLQANIADLSYVNRIYYIQSLPFPAGYSRTGQALTLDWTGDPTIACGHGGGTGAGNSYSFNFGSDANTDYIVCFYSNNTQRANPAKNLRLYLTANQTAINAGQIFEPVYVNMLKQGAGVLRFMDYFETNNSPVLTYSTFATEAYRQWADSGIPGVANAPYGAPISIITKLANLTNKHPWINVPNRLGTPKFATIKSMTPSGSPGATTVVTTTYAHNFVAGDVVIPYQVDGNGTGNSGWGQQSTVSINVSTGTVTWPGHAFVKGQNVWFSGGTLPSVSGQSANISQRSFYITNPNTSAGTFQLAATPAAAQAGTVVSLTGTATGTITGVSGINRNAFVVGSNNLTANTLELTNCDSSNFGATRPTQGSLTSPFSLTGMTTEVGNLATAIKSQLNNQLVPRFEFSNEMWNPIFDAFAWNAAQAHSFVDGSGNPIFPQDDNNKLAGYLAAHVMKTVRDIYGGSSGRTNWRGNLATWWGVSGWTNNLVSGVSYYLANYAPASGLVLTDLFNDVATTGYYGNIWYSNGFFGNFPNATISIGTNAKVTLASGTSSLPIGSPIIFSTTGSLPSPLVAWSASTPPAYSTGVYWTTSLDTGSGFTFTATNNNGVLGANVTTSGSQSGTQTVQSANASLIANWMNDSYAHFLNQDGSYPTKYSYFNTMVNLEVGDGRFMKNPYAVSVLASNWANNIVAGLGMVQYEGGSGNYANAGQYAANGTQYVFDAQTQEYFSNAFATQEDAANWTGMVNAWKAFGAANSITVGSPAKYVEATNVAYSASLLASFGANYYVDHFQGFGTGVPGNPLWTAIANTN